ncbi:HNH endonuclease [Arthrobacter sp. NPDC056727]|uniref:HNH endonuclease n=1 Tax=Arthrobacter sp. NPDC056727 TaxID=3345927 RepID=UPI00367357F9
MEVLGDSALAAEAPQGDFLHAAAVPEALVPAAVFPFDAVPAGWLTGEVFPFDGFAGVGFPGDGFLEDGVPFDDHPDAVYPEDPFPGGEYADGDFPEDPFPEALFYRSQFTGSGASCTGTPRPSLDDRIGEVKTLLRADLTADGPGLIDQIRAGENIKAMIAGQQARLAVAFEARQRREQAEFEAGTGPGQAHRSALAAEDLGRKRPQEHTMGVAEQVALARGESPHRGGRLLGVAKALVTGMPHALGALDTGQLNEEKAMYVVKETACLTVEDRAAVDEELAADTGTFDGVGTRGVIAAVKAAATRRDPRSVTQRASHAASERGVSLRPAPDCMTYLTALLPAHQGVAVYTALTRQADALRSAGDPRSRNQAMADTLVESITGTPGGITGIEVNLVMTDRTLLQGDTEPARLTGYGIVPAGWARNLLNPEQAQETAHQEDAAKDAVKDLKIWLRRLYTAPDPGDLVAMDSRRRLFPPPLRRFIQIRDDTCRTPYCDAPIRHHDHIIPWHNNGPTSLANGAGLCEACNHTKELPGWKTQPRPGPRHTIEITTPTGHTYRSTAPPLPGTRLSGTGVGESGVGESRLGGTPSGTADRGTHQSQHCGPAP